VFAELPAVFEFIFKYIVCMYSIRIWAFFYNLS